MATVGKSIYDFYDAHASPHSSLKNSEKRLEKVRSRLQALSPQRREEIEIASQVDTADDESSLKSIADLERELEVLSDMYCRLSKRHEEASLKERYLPRTQLWVRLDALKNRAKALLEDTWNTTVPYIDDIEFDSSTEV